MAAVATKNEQGIIDRLKQEKASTCEEYRAEGVRDGAAWANKAHYRQLKYAAEIWGPFGNYGYSPDLVLGDKVLGEYFQDTMSDDPIMSGDLSTQHDQLSDETSIWLEGWKEAVSDFWKEKCSNL